MWPKFLIQTLLLGTVQAVPYSEYILAPASRTVFPVSVYRTTGTVDNAEAIADSAADGSVILSGSSSVTLDFGKNIAGQVSLTTTTSGNANATLGLTYTESSVYVSDIGCDSTANSGLDRPLIIPVGRTYTVERKHARGGFRYLSVINNGTEEVELSDLSVYFTAAPTQDLQKYTGYFHSNDELLNRVWYAGAYTNQLCTIDSKYGDALVSLESDEPLQDWYYNYTITNGSSCMVDGAKRDTLVWPGDFFVAIPSALYSTYDLDSVQNSMESLLLLQLANGLLPYVGVPFDSMIDAVSFTYHLHNLIGVYNYYLYSGDESWLQRYWDQFKLGLAWSISNIDSTGLMNVTASADWLRSGMGGHNIEANAILYYVLGIGTELANILGDHDAASNYTATATRLKTAANQRLWDEAQGLYVDNETTTMTPQDGNSFAVLANLTLSATQSTTITTNLQSRWGPYGAPAPECASTPATISPFAGGFELEAHLVAGATTAALDLMRLQWGDYMLDDPRMTNSTFIEGYSADGSLHYAPYALDSRISLAHGWATAPTNLLSRYVAGIRLTAAAGSEWLIKPQVGDLKAVSAGMSTVLGEFSVAIAADGNGGITAFNFSTPTGTTGTLALPQGSTGTLTSEGGDKIVLSGGTVTGVNGGSWTYLTS